jgi:transglutaminase-like putative cysteine protease
MTYRVVHTSAYRYSKPVSLCHNLVHLRPRDDAPQTCTHWELEISPQPKLITEQLDCFGNHATYFTVEEPHDRLTVRASSQMEVSPTAPPDGAASLPWERSREFLQADRSPRGLEACQFVFDSPYVKAAAELVRYAAPSFTAGRPLLEAALDLTHRIYADFLYDPTATTITTPLREVLDQRRGVCQDFAHLEIGCLRSLGLAARYVSGYLRTEPPPGQPRLVGVDASHAWLSVYCPHIGWVGLDPTNDQVPSDKHILLAWGRDYDDVSPIKGVNLGGGRHSVTVGVDVALVDNPEVGMGLS